MRVVVDARKCQGHTLCHQQAPEIFLLDESQGHAYVKQTEVPKGMEEKVHRAAMACPEQAIVVTEK